MQKANLSDVFIMKMKLNLFIILVVVVFHSCKMKDTAGSERNACLTSFVDPYIGTGGHGHTFLGVTVPFGAVQIGPANINKGWDWCSGYHYSDSIIIGFAHLHLNGTGCSDSGDLLFMPYTGEIKTGPGTQKDPGAGYGSRYSHRNEKAKVGYYSVVLEDHNINVELTATRRVAFHRYTFSDEKKEKQVMINLKDANGDDRPVETFIEQVDEKTVRGYRFSTGWSKKQEIYFTAVFSQPVELTVYDDSIPVGGKSFKSVNIKGNLSVKSEEKSLDIKVGISPVSMKNAENNIISEIPEWNFDAIVAQTTQAWETELEKITIETNDTVAKRNFYTAMYHAFMQPVIFNDYNNDYRGTDKIVYENAKFTNYTVFSLWDTYRAAHPLYTLLQQESVPDFIKSMLAIYDQQGRLPVWHLYGSDTHEMIGIQSVPVIADAILKDIPGFNYRQAYDAMKNSMLSDYKGLNYIKELGYIPSDLEGESVAKGLEYAIADWGTAQVAKKLGEESDYRFFSERAKNYRHYWDNSTRFFRGKTKDGKFSSPFDPIRSTHRRDDYCEGNAWQYIWMVPHDVEGLIALFGSEEAFVSKLDSLFMLEASLGEEASPDISGLIGQYAHGNEPGHHIIYLYAFVGQQWKTAEKARYILKNMYKDRPDGLIGNEDCGQMSSWYIFSSLGFYPVNPSNGIYVFGSPLFDKVTITLPGDKKWEIIAENNSERNSYIQSVELNGKPYSNSYITHTDIMKGGILKFRMGAKPNLTFGTEKKDRPGSFPGEEHSKAE